MSRSSLTTTLTGKKENKYFENVLHKKNKTVRTILTILGPILGPF